MLPKFLKYSLLFLLIISCSEEKDIDNNNYLLKNISSDKTNIDFENNLIENGGISWMNHDYVSSSSEEEVLESFKMWTSDDDSLLHTSVPNEMATADFQIKLINAEGKNIFTSKATGNSSVTLPKLNAGIYFAFLYNENKLVFEEKLFFQD